MKRAGNVEHIEGKLNTYIHTYKGLVGKPIRASQGNISFKEIT
jgi:hypothetical protein